MHVYKTRGPQQPCSKSAQNSDSVPSLSDPDIRADLVRRVREEIAAGTYDTPEKFALAFDRMVRELE